MKKIIIVIPVFNDWESLQKLLTEININIKDFKEFTFDCLVINDASTINRPKIFKPKNIKSLKVINMKKNQGHARCNAFALRFISQNKSFDNLILMDGDGEDRPIEIKSLVETIINKPNNSVVAKRIKRSEGPFFQFLYKIHKMITFLFTGNRINFGNYSCLTKEDVKVLSTKASLWSSYSGTLKKNIKILNEVNSIRGLRYFGPSQMSLYKLLIHSFSIIAVFKYQVLLRCIILLLLFEYLNNYLGVISSIFQFFIGIFCGIIFLVSLREKESELINSQNNLKDVEEVLQ